MKETLFELGPYKVCMWNVIISFFAFLGGYILRKIIYRYLKDYLTNVNIQIEGKRRTWLKLFSQSVFALAVYISVMSFNINNKDVTFSQFLDYNFIDTNKLKLSFGNIILVLVIVFLARVAINISRLVIQRRYKKRQEKIAGSEYIVIQVSKYIINVFAFFLILAALDVDTTLFLGGSAALLVGLGLGLQDVFKDMFSGLVLLFERSIQKGDVIEINDGKSSEAIIAKVLDIKVRTTQIETRDGNVLIVPNAKLTQEYIENWSHGTTLSRFRIPITVSFGSDTHLVRELLIQAVYNHPHVNRDKEIQVRLNNFSDRGLEMEVTFWADQNWDINIYKSEMRFEIDRLFRENGITIPYPKRDVTMK
jgi:small-conductance mechanosensitive channel